MLKDPRRNVGQLWVPGRGPTTAYVKRQLVPFGEYIPFRGIISSFSSLPSLQPVDFTPGRRAVVFDDGQIRLGDVICYEVGFDNLVRSEVTAGANLLAVQSNDADFEIDGQLGETEQQTAMARIRAVESDRAVVYASTTGESTIIAPDGRADRAQRRLAAGDPGRAGAAGELPHAGGPGWGVAGVRDHHAHRARARLGGLRSLVPGRAGTGRGPGPDKIKPNAG